MRSDMLPAARHAVTIVILGLLGNPAARAQTIIDYGRECATKIAPIPAFDCRSGTEMKITVNELVPSTFQPNMTCDRPSLLPYSEPGAEGQCIPFSRALVLCDDKRTQIIAVCRQKTIRTLDAYLFDEVDIIAHSVTSGETCWFQALAPPPLSPGQGLDGRRVPPPDEATPPPGRPAAATFWRPPADTAAARCVDCHDSDPFMYTPFVAQTGQLPKDPFGKYANNIGEAFKTWPRPYAITTRGNTCTGCHRIGSLETCHKTIRQAVGLVPVPGEDNWAQQFPQSHWMPPGTSLTPKAWNIVYQQSVQELANCCVTPTAPGCRAAPITRGTTR